MFVYLAGKKAVRVDPGPKIFFSLNEGAAFLCIGC